MNSLLSAFAPVQYVEIDSTIREGGSLLSGYGRIIDICSSKAGRCWSEAQAIDEIRRGVTAFFVRDSVQKNRTIPIEPYGNGLYGVYLKTIADGRPTDNLDNLPATYKAA